MASSSMTRPRIANPFFRAIAGIVSAEAAIQASNLLVGLLILRYLSLSEYAIYIIAGTLAGIGAVLANMGLYPGTSFYVARAGETQDRVANVVTSASYLQNWLIGFAALGVVVIGGTYLHQFHSLFELATVIAIILLQVVIAARLELARSILYAQQRARPIVAANAAIAALRLATIVPMLLAIPSIGVLPVLAANALAQLVGFVSLRSAAPQRSQRHDTQQDRQLLRYMVPLWPENLYYLAQGNIAVMAIAWLGGHSQVAELGALTRLVQIVMILSVLNRFVVQPYVARYDSLRDFRHRSLQVLSIYAGGSMLLLLLAWLAPQPFLLVLGAQYQHLTGYVLPVMALAVVSLGGTVAYWLCLSSGHTAGMSLTVPFGIVIQVSYIALVGLESVAAAVGFMLATALGEFATRLGVLAWLGYSLNPTRQEPAVSAPCESAGAVVDGESKSPRKPVP